jgi:hypothetical protein
MIRRLLVAAPARNGGACRFEGGKIAFPGIAIGVREKV